MPDDRTVDFVVMFLVFGSIGLGLLSMAVGWVVRTWDRIVNHSQIVMSFPVAVKMADARTDEADGPSLSAVDMAVEQLEVDRTKKTVIEVLVYNGWTTAEIRAVIKGENAAIGAEVEAARERLGIDPPDRTLKVRDAAGERVISY